ncbi:glycosyltransferase [Candidatus Poribacteria bacterium]|nr:glycosyltransferase [Candidatus Poribacteria bacterium]
MENGVANLVNHHNFTCFDPMICTLVGGGALTRRVNTTKVKLIELNKSSGNDPRITIQLWRVFKQEKPHIVHTHAWGTLCEGVIAAKLAGVPVIVHGEHGTIECRKKNIWIQRLLWGATDQVLSVSDMLRKELATEIGFPLEKIKPIINGVDTQKFSVFSNKERLKNTLGKSPDDVVIGTVGRLVPVKDYSTFLKALQILLKAGKEFHAIFVGDGPLNGELQCLANELRLSKNVTFLGNRHDIPDLLNTMDIFVLTSLHEGISNTILEAMACGLPVVATNVGGTPEIVEDGKTGILVSVQNPDELAGVIEILIENKELRGKMGKQGRRRVEENFSLERMVKNYEGLYLSLVWAKNKTSCCFLKDP